MLLSWILVALIGSIGVVIFGAFILLFPSLTAREQQKKHVIGRADFEGAAE